MTPEAKLKFDAKVKRVQDAIALREPDRIPIKPDPTGVYEILKEFGADKSECLYFGDTNTDMMTGHNAGVTTVGVTWGFRPRTELEEYKADIIIDSAREIPGLIR